MCNLVAELETLFLWDYSRFCEQGGKLSPRRRRISITHTVTSIVILECPGRVKCLVVTKEDCLLWGNGHDVEHHIDQWSKSRR